jgi:hypothetical protein
MCLTHAKIWGQCPGTSGHCFYSSDSSSRVLWCFSTHCTVPMSHCKILLLSVDEWLADVLSLQVWSKIEVASNIILQEVMHSGFRKCLTVLTLEVGSNCWRTVFWRQLHSRASLGYRVLDVVPVLELFKLTSTLTPHFTHIQFMNFCINTNVSFSFVINFCCWKNISSHA